MSQRVSLQGWILVPSLITLAVTLLRLAGELLGWTSTLFNTSAGGGGAVVGIAWLVPIFGAYFGWKLRRQGLRSVSTGKAILFPVVGLVLMVCLGMLNFSIFAPGSLPSLIFFSLACLLPIGVTACGWRELFRLLLYYGLAARLPVVGVMFFAILGDWGTHYDATPDNLPPMGWFTEWLVTGLVPQLTFWMAYTVLVGGIFGWLGSLLAREPGK